MPATAGTATATVLPQIPLSGQPPTPDEAQQAHRRTREARWLNLGSLLYTALLLGGFLRLGGTHWLARITARCHGRWVPALLMVLGVLGVAGALLMLPVDYFAGFIFPHRFGLSSQTAGAWFRDYAVGQGVTAAVGIPVILLGYLLLRRAPRTWWWWLGGVSLPISILVMLIVPVFITPLFNTFTPLRNSPLRREILAMADAQGIPVHDVYEVDASRQSRAADAYVIGVGPTQRIVLYDTLLDNFTPAEIEFILAHEMGHYKLRHIAWGIAMSVVATLAGGFLLSLAARGVFACFGTRLGVTGLSDPAAFPVLLALVLGLALLLAPLGLAFSRLIERQADQFALRIDPHPTDGISAFHKLARLNIAEEDPPVWAVLLYGTHPAIGERITMLEQAHQRP